MKLSLFMKIIIIIKRERKEKSINACNHLTNDEKRNR